MPTVGEMLLPVVIPRRFTCVEPTPLVVNVRLGTVFAKSRNCVAPSTSRLRSKSAWRSPLYDVLLGRRTGETAGKPNPDKFFYRGLEAHVDADAHRTRLQRIDLDAVGHVVGIEDHAAAEVGAAVDQVASEYPDGPVGARE